MFKSLRLGILEAFHSACGNDDSILNCKLERFLLTIEDDFLRAAEHVRERPWNWNGHTEHFSRRSEIFPELNHHTRILAVGDNREWLRKSIESRMSKKAEENGVDLQCRVSPDWDDGKTECEVEITFYKKGYGVRLDHGIARFPL